MGTSGGAGNITGCRSQTVPLYYWPVVQRRIYLSRNSRLLLAGANRLKRTLTGVVIILASLSISACASVQATHIPTVPTPNGLVNAAATPVPTISPTQKPTQEPLA